MRSKKLIAILLTLCLVMTLFAPAASAVQVRPSGSTTSENTQKNESGKDNTSRLDNSLLVSGEKTNILDLRDEIKETLNNTTAEKETSISLRNERLDAVLAELKETSKLYDKNEKVSAFVVMEGAALAETHSSVSQVTEDEENALLSEQALVIQKIEKTVLAGAELNVRYQFTYLANAFSVLTEFDNLDEIAKIEGVKSVFVMPTYEPTIVDAPYNFSSGAMTGVHQVWENLSYTGTGMKIAVVDTGLDLDHPAFAADPATNENSMTVTDVDNVLLTLHAYEAMGGNLTAEDLYNSTKVPYAFNYVDLNLTADHSSDSMGDHGTHVAGISAANKMPEDGIAGMAPDAQIIVMKVFGANGGAYLDDYVAAIEDAMFLDCDVVNLSLGSDNGFTESGYAFAEGIFANLENQDIIATISAGNSGVMSSGNLWGTDLNRTNNPENGVVGSPSTYVNAFSIASAQNENVWWENFILADGTRVHYMPSVEILYGYVASFEESLLPSGQPAEFEYVIIEGLGEVADFYDAEGNSLVDGKIAIVQRGTINFSDKVSNAADAGAVACLIWNNQEQDIYSFGMTTAIDSANQVYPSIPAVLITQADGQKMADAEVKTMTVTFELSPRQDTNGGQMSTFSSWGPTSDLRLLPDITGVGGNVYSCYDGGVYGLMSGTSMSAPQVAGVSALVLQVLKERYPELAEDDDGTLREMAMALLMSTADPVISSTSGYEASPRQQGAGLVNALEAITSNAYLTVDGGRPKVEMKDKTSGSYTFTFEINNTSDVEQTYTVNSSLLTEMVTAYAEYPGEYFMAGVDTALSGTVDCGGDTITVPAGETVEVDVRVTLSEDDKAYFDTYWPNGGYVEGFIYLDNVDEEEVDLNLPFFGFYGKWDSAPIFDSAMWYETGMWGMDDGNASPDGDQYFTALWASMGGQDWVLGINPYSGPIAGEDGQIVYDPYNNVLSPNGDGYLDEIGEIYLSLLRNVKELTITWSVGDKILQKDIIDNVGKTSYNSNYGQIVPWVGSWYYDGFYDEFDQLEDGTKLTLTFDAKIDYKRAKTQTLSFDIYIDLTAPELLGITEESREDGTEHLIIDVKENHSLAAITLLNPTGTRILDAAYDAEFVRQPDGTYRVDMDITGMGTEFVIAICDYAANEAYFEHTYTSAADGNLPEMDTSLLYGYRVGDTLLQDYVGWDYIFGWVSMNKPEEDASGYNASWVYRESDDHLEYYSLNAAEYAGGKIFAFDAGGNFLYMEPGLWNRKVIASLGVNVLDMAFDDTTDTMYVLVKNTYDASYSETILYSIDLLTGEMTEVCNLYDSNYAPWSMTVADDGTIYTILPYDSTLYTLTVVTEEYSWGSWSYPELVAVVDPATEEPLQLLKMNGNPAVPEYAQSMTFADGKIYWAYFRGLWGGNESEMFVIDTENNFSYTAYPYITYYEELGGSAYSDSEYVGLMTLDETEYQIPEATELLQLNLSQTFAGLKLGETLALTAYAIPWNYEIDALTWTSSDESVVTVDENGVVTTVGAGVATVTVSHGDVVAACEVTVADVSGGFYAYDFMTGSGMYYVDNNSMDASFLGAAPFDFIVGDYNGHDGWYYGYDVNYQLVKWNISTGETETIGTPVMKNIADMAYDYTTGLLYVLEFSNTDYMSYIHMVDVNTGELVPYAVCPDALVTLSVDNNGMLYAMAAYGALCYLALEDGAMYGYDTWIAWIMPILENLPATSYLQTMTYDWNNDVMIWSNMENQMVYWMDHNAEVPYVVELGNPMPDGMWLTGMFSIPNEISALPAVAVDDVIVSNLTMMSGATLGAPVSVRPLNANGYTVTMSSSDPSIADVIDGTVYAYAPGEATITVTVNDGNGSGEPIVKTFKVTVLEAADNLYGYLSGDLATYIGEIWFELPVSNPSAPVGLAQTNMIVYAGEYYNGKLYTVGYYDDSVDDDSWYLSTLNPETFEIESQINLGEGFPFVYDMTYDYTTSTMYCVAGQGSTASNLYALDIATGEMVLILETPDQFFMGLTASPSGKLYAVAASQTDPDTWELMGADLYTIDPTAGTMELIGNTGILLQSLTSMAYDYDTDTIYWSALYYDMWDAANNGKGGLAVINPTTGEASLLGNISTNGAQVTSLFFVCDEYPEEPEPTISKVLMNPAKVSLTVGATTQMSITTLPFGLDTEITWSVTDPRVASIDENGVVTALRQGATKVVATIDFNGQIFEATANVAVLNEDASFLTYNSTQNRWASISRADNTVTFLTEASDEPCVNALASIGGAVYGFDAENTLFSLNTETFERTAIGTVDVSALILSYLEFRGFTTADADLYAFELFDMEYDVANDRVLVLGEFTKEGWEIEGGHAILEVNMETAALTVLHAITDYNGVQAMAVGDDGIVYCYSSLQDDYFRLDLTTGATKNLYSLQRQSLSGSSDGVHELHYDLLTGKLYHVLTNSNDRFARFLSYDIPSETLTLEAQYLGETVQEGFYIYGDHYSALTFVDTSAAPNYEAAYSGGSASLNGTIGLNFYFTMSEDVLYAEDAKVVFTHNGQPIEVPVSEGKYNATYGDYGFTIQLAAKEMADVITAQVFVGDQAISDVKEYSVQQYAMNMLGKTSTSESVKSLLKAMLNYGAAAQAQFNYNVENLANAQMEEADKLLPDVDTETLFARDVYGESEVLTFNGTSLILESGTVVRAYFLYSGEDISQVNFTINGEPVTPVYLNGEYYIEISDVKANHLSEIFTFTADEITIQYSAMSYVRSKLENTATSETLVNMSKALYAYAMEAEAYFNILDVYDGAGTRLFGCSSLSEAFEKMWGYSATIHLNETAKLTKDEIVDCTVYLENADLIDENGFAFKVTYNYIEEWDYGYSNYLYSDAPVAVESASEGYYAYEGYEVSTWLGYGQYIYEVTENADAPIVTVTKEDGELLYKGQSPDQGVSALRYYGDNWEEFFYNGTLEFVNEFNAENEMSIYVGGELTVIGAANNNAVNFVLQREDTVIRADAPLTSRVSVDMNSLQNKIVVENVEGDQYVYTTEDHTFLISISQYGWNTVFQGDSLAEALAFVNAESDSWSTFDIAISGAVTLDETVELGAAITITGAENITFGEGASICLVTGMDAWDQPMAGKITSDAELVVTTNEDAKTVNVDTTSGFGYTLVDAG